MTHDDERWLNEQIARDRAARPNERWAIWLLLSLLVAWFAIGSVIALTIRLIEVARA